MCNICHFFLSDYSSIKSLFSIVKSSSVFSFDRLPETEGEDCTLGGSKDERWGQMRQCASQPSSHRLWPPFSQLQRDDVTNALIQSPPCQDNAHWCVLASWFTQKYALSRVIFEDFWFHLESLRDTEGSWSLADILHNKLCNWYTFSSHAYHL